MTCAVAPAPDRDCGEGIAYTVDPSGWIDFDILWSGRRGSSNVPTLMTSQRSFVGSETSAKGLACCFPRAGSIGREMHSRLWEGVQIRIEVVRRGTHTSSPLASSDSLPAKT